MGKQKTCSIADCGDDSRSRGWCPKHYARWKRTGDPNATITLRGVSIAERLELKSRWLRDGCLEYTGTISADGYGTMTLGTGSPQLAHRLAYEDEYGPIPAGRDVRHTCANRACIKRSHLILGPQKKIRGDAVTDPSALAQ